jgi:ABC-type Mn2+/Zn2+ transport system ATPase subunit
MMPQEKDQSAISLHRVSFWYPSAGASQSVLRDISLDVRFGEILRLDGRNGSGKTTLLKLITGDLKPTIGTRTMNRPSLRTTYLDQNALRFIADSLTLREQLMVGAHKSAHAFSRPSGSDSSAAVSRLFTQFAVGIESRLDDFTAHLSEGQRQVIALIATLASDPDVIALDEFTSFLDVDSQKSAASLVGRCAAAGKAVVLISHGDTHVTPDRTVRLP